MIWRTAYNVPEVYPAESRDFQLLGRLLDSVMNGVKFNIDAIKYLSSTADIMSSLLPLLQEKLGFFSKEKFTDQELRYILDAFPTIIKYKGSKKGIEEAINVFLRLHCMDSHTVYSIVVGDDSTSDSGYLEYDILNKYSIHIKIQSTPRDTKVLDEIFRYILPTGYLVEYIFYQTVNTSASDYILYKDTVNIDVRSNTLNNLRPSIDESELDTESKQRNVGTVGDTEVDSKIEGV